MGTIMSAPVLDRRVARRELVLAAYFLSVAALMFCAVAGRLLGLRDFCSLLLSLPLRVLGRPDSLHGAFWLSAGYYAVGFLPAVLYGLTGRARWLALQAGLAACHVGCAVLP